MRLLYLTNGFPYPLTSGYLRHYHLLRQLAPQHRISLLSIVGPSFREEHTSALEPFTERIETFPSGTKGASLPRKVLNRFRSRFGGDPAVEAMRQQVERLSGEREFDAVFCGKRTYPAIASLERVPFVADMCDATSVRIRGSLRFASMARVPILLLEYLQTRRIEQRMMYEAAHSVFITCRDREAVAPSAAVPTTVMPNGVDVDFWKRETRQIGVDTIAFTGAMDYRPNTDAALHLIEEVLPVVRRSLPEAKLLIVGRDPTAALVQAGQQEGVTVTGFVEDVRPYLERATVFAAPLRFGAGIQNKVLEAMAMEVPVVASELAADGLRTEDGQRAPVVVAESVEDFAERIVGILRERKADPVPDARARRYVEKNYVWSASAAKLDRVLHLVGRKEATCSPLP